MTQKKVRSGKFGLGRSTGWGDFDQLIHTLPSFKFDVSIEHVRFEQLLTLFTTIFQLLSFPYRIYITIQYPFDHVT